MHVHDGKATRCMIHSSSPELLSQSAGTNWACRADPLQSLNILPHSLSYCADRSTSQDESCTGRHSQTSCVTEHHSNWFYTWSSAGQCLSRKPLRWRRALKRSLLTDCLATWTCSKNEHVPPKGKIHYSTSLQLTVVLAAGGTLESCRTQRFPKIGSPVNLNKLCLDITYSSCSFRLLYLFQHTLCVVIWLPSLHLES